MIAMRTRAGKFNIWLGIIFTLVMALAVFTSHNVQHMNTNQKVVSTQYGHQ